MARVVTDDVLGLLQRHSDLLGALAEWIVRLLFYKRVEPLGASFREAFMAEHSARCPPP